MNFPFQLPIFTAALLSLAGTISAQTPEAIPPFPAPATPPPLDPSDTLSEMRTYLHLGPGTMAGAAKSLEESYFEKYTKTGQDEDLMPKLIYGPGAEDAAINGELQLSLYNRRALDALALVAAAAGCRLEPIPAPPESPDEKKKPQRVVGYYVTFAMRPTTTQATKPVFMDLPAGAVVGTIGLTLGEQNGDVLIRDVVPGLPAAQSRAIAPGEKLLSIAEEGATEVRAAELGTEKVSEMLVGEPGTRVRVTVAPPHGEGQPKVVLLTRQPLQPTLSPPHPPLVRVVEPVVDTLNFINTDARPNPGMPGHAASTPNPSGNITDLAMAAPGIPGMPSASPVSTGPLVRIYPVAFFIKGSEEDLAKKQIGLEEVVQEALQHAKLDAKDTPLLSLHSATKVLIVKATPPQHEIIQQIITSLKENEQAGAQDQGAPRR